MNSTGRLNYINKREIYENNIVIINNLLKSYKYRKIINSLKFSCFFYLERKSFTLGYFFWQLKRIFKICFSLKSRNDLTFIVNDENIVTRNKTVSFCSIDTMNAIHYQKIGSKLNELIKNEILTKGISFRHSTLVASKQQHTFGWRHQLAAKLKALLIICSFTFRTYFLGDKEARKLVFNNIDKLFIHVVKYLLEFKFYSLILSRNTPNFVMTVNENWMPQSVIIDCCKRLNIPTVIYPHGIIGSTITLPSECDIFLYWNDQMKDYISHLTTNKEKNIVIGAIEPLVEEHLLEPLVVEYDVLIISQLSVANENENIIYKDIFFVWENYLRAYPTFKVCIKLHPFEGEKEFDFLCNLFEPFGDQVVIVHDSHITISTLVHKSKRISTVTSSAITYGFYLKKPILLYNPPKALFYNFPVSENWIFRNKSELEEIIANEHMLFSNFNNKIYSWVDEQEIKRNVRALVDRIIK